MAGRQTKKRRWNYGLILAVEAVILIILFIIYGIFYMNHAMDGLNIDSNWNKDEIEVNENLNIDMEEYTNIVVFGGDSREGSVGQGTHSDAVIIVNINNDTKEVRLVSVYRDSYLEIAKENADNQKFTHAHFIGGPAMAINTLNRNLDLNITDYVTVNFMSVIKAVDIMGGIEIELEKKELKAFNKCIKEQNKLYGTELAYIEEPGTYTMNGTQALAYSRIRSTDQGDITRTERQREVIGLMVDKLKSKGLTCLDELIDEVLPMISTSIPKSDLIALATNMFSYELAETRGFPFTYEPVKLGSPKGDVLAPADLEHNVMALHKYLFGTENYQVSDTVLRINTSIQSETGARYKKIDILEEGKEEDTSAEDALE